MDSRLARLWRHGTVTEHTHHESVVHPGAVQGGPNVTANGTYMLTFLILEVQQTRGVENARKRRPHFGKKFEFKKLDSSGRGTGKTRITIFVAYRDPMLNRWPLK